MKLRLKGRLFDTTEEIHAETQDVIDTLTFESFQGDALNNGKHAGIAVYVPRGLLRGRRGKLGVTAGNFFYGKIPRIFG